MNRELILMRHGQLNLTMSGKVSLVDMQLPGHGWPNTNCPTAQGSADSSPGRTLPVAAISSHRPIKLAAQEKIVNAKRYH